MTPDLQPVRGQAIRVARRAPRRLRFASVVAFSLMAFPAAAADNQQEAVTGTTERNAEFGRELLWREYPTGTRGSQFREFWNGDGRGSHARSPAGAQGDAVRESVDPARFGSPASMQRRDRVRMPTPQQSQRTIPTATIKYKEESRAPSQTSK
jgi:hypothetical protein